MRVGIILLVLLMSSCEFFKPKEVITEAPVAMVMENVLYPSDLDGLFPESMSSLDSVKLAEKYVEDWIKKQLMISQSTQEINFNEAEIERRVLDYRYALIVHAFEKKYIESNLSREVHDSVINNYYAQKADNFLLRQNIVKCIFAQVPKSAPNLYQFRRNFRSFPDSSEDDLKNFLNQFAVKSYLEDSTWVIFDEVILGTPLETTQNRTQFLNRTNYSETSDDEYIYFLKIFEFKISDQVSPLEFIREDIETIIINKRKIALKKELEENIYEEAKANNTFEIYRD